jgi:hypothetical protein
MQLRAFAFFLDSRLFGSYIDAWREGQLRLKAKQK